MARKTEDKPSVGRSTDLTPAVQSKIVEALRAGNTQKASAAYAGVAVATFYEWIARGKGTHSRSQEPIYAEFAEAVEKAEADAEVAHVALIKKAAMSGTWTASAWWLERRRPDDYSLRSKVSYEDTTMSAADLAEVRKAATPEEVADLRRLIGDPSSLNDLAWSILRRARLAPSEDS